MRKLGLTAKQRERWDDAAMALLWAETVEAQKNNYRIRAMKTLLEEAPEKDQK